jgi:hypothetical protein
VRLGLRFKVGVGSAATFQYLWSGQRSMGQCLQKFCLNKVIEQLVAPAPRLFKIKLCSEHPATRARRPDTPDFSCLTGGAGAPAGMKGATDNYMNIQLN